MTHKLTLANSFIFSFVFLAHPELCVAIDVEAGPIWSNGHAQTVCPDVCKKAMMTWSGQWSTTIPGKMSVCGCSQVDGVAPSVAEKIPTYGQNETEAARVVGVISQQLHDRGVVTPGMTPPWPLIRDELKKKTAVERKFTLKTALDQYNEIFMPDVAVEDPSISGDE